MIETAASVSEIIFWKSLDNGSETELEYELVLTQHEIHSESYRLQLCTTCHLIDHCSDYFLNSRNPGNTCEISKTEIAF